jgi:hypothetical protein
MRKTTPPVRYHPGRRPCAPPVTTARRPNSETSLLTGMSDTSATAIARIPLKISSGYSSISRIALVEIRALPRPCRRKRAARQIASPMPAYPPGGQCCHASIHWPPLPGTGCHDRSKHRCATVDSNCLASDVVGLVTGEKDRGGCDVVRCAEKAQCDLR